MAKVLGESGRYVSDSAEKAFRKMLVTVMTVLGSASFVSGFSFCLSIRTPFAPYVTGCVALILGLAIWLLWRHADRQLSALSEDRRKMLRGAEGEATVGYRLSGLSDDYRVINDLSTPFGNIDHVVVGPTGVFLLDTKNWRGNLRLFSTNTWVAPK